MSESVRAKFIELLKNEKFSEVEELFSEDIYEVEDMMDLRTESEYQKIEPHWSAVQTGELISTPLHVLKKISDHLSFKKNSTLIDIGSGHGFPSLVFGSLNPTLKVIGYEIVKEKVVGARKSASRVCLNNLEFQEQDLSKDDFYLKSADYYYIYNSANEKVLKKLLYQICELSKTNKVTLISAGGVDEELLIDNGFCKDGVLEDIGITCFCSK